MPNFYQMGEDAKQGDLVKAVQHPDGTIKVMKMTEQEVGEAHESMTKQHTAFKAILELLEGEARKLKIIK